MSQGAEGRKAEFVKSIPPLPALSYPYRVSKREDSLQRASFHHVRFSTTESISQVRVRTRKPHHTSRSIFRALSSGLGPLPP